MIDAALDSTHAIVRFVSKFRQRQSGSEARTHTHAYAHGARERDMRENSHAHTRTHSLTEQLCDEHRRLSRCSASHRCDLFGTWPQAPPPVDRAALRCCCCVACPRELGPRHGVGTNGVVKSSQQRTKTQFFANSQNAQRVGTQPRGPTLCCGPLCGERRCQTRRRVNP
jgi:hypothetical protein